MNIELSPITRACIPVTSLPLLAGLRRHTGIRVALYGPDAWLQWPGGDEQVVAQLLAIAGVRFYREREDAWYAHGSRLPAHHLPAQEPSRPLDQVLLPPAKERQPVIVPRIEPVRVRLISDNLPRPTTALICSPVVLSEWADHAPCSHIERLRGARCNSRVLILGESLPLLPENRRFWGERLLIPLGQRYEPAVSENDLLEAWGASADEIVLFDGLQAEIIPTKSLMPLSRASIRLAARGDVQ